MAMAEYIETLKGTRYVSGSFQSSIAVSGPWRSTSP